jgi:hypothetical protein
VVVATYPCPCCGGTGRLRDPRPGEFVDVPDTTPTPPAPGGGEIDGNTTKSTGPGVDFSHPPHPVDTRCGRDIRGFTGPRCQLRKGHDGPCAERATPTPAPPASGEEPPPRPVRPHTPGWKIPAPKCPHGRERDFCTECLPTPTPDVDRAWHCEPCATIHVGDCPQGHVSEVRRLRLDCARLARELEEARGRENHALARLDAARAEAARSDMALRATLAAILLNKVVCQHEYPDRTGWRLHSLEAALEEAGRLIDMATEDAARAEEDEKDEQ